MRGLAMKSLGFAALALSLVGCSSKEPEQASQPAPSTPVSVTTAEASMRTVPSLYEAVGTVRARTSTNVASRMMGYVRDLRVNLGDRVTAGQVLLTLNAQEIDSQIRQAEAAVAEARSAQPEIEGAVNAAKAQLDLAQATFSRMQDLFNKKSVSNQEFDEVSAKRKLAEAGLSMAQAKRDQLNAKIQQAEQAVRSAQIMQSYTTVTAPASGIVTSKSVEAGALVTPGTPLLTIEQDSGWRLEAAVEESRLGAVRVGQSVEVEIDALPVSSGRVSEIVPTVDSASRTFTAKIDLPASANLRGGLFGRARFRFGEQKALMVPETAVVSQGQLQKVYVIDSGVARARMITTGAVSRDGVAILSGLSEGERVVSPAPPQLADGARVEVRQ